MEDTGDSDLFEIRLNNDGIRAITSFAGKVKWVMLLSILISFIFMAGAILRIVHFNPSIYKVSSLISFEAKIHDYYVVIYCFLVLVQVYFYWKTGVTLKKSIDKRDEAGFNNSFNYLLRSCVLSIIGCFLGFIMNGFELYIMLKYYYPG